MARDRAKRGRDESAAHSAEQPVSSKATKRSHQRRHKRKASEAVNAIACKRHKARPASADATVASQQAPPYFSSPGWKRHVLYQLLPSIRSLASYLTSESVGLSQQSILKSDDADEYVKLVRETLVVPFTPFARPVGQSLTPPGSGSERLRAVLLRAVDRTLYRPSARPASSASDYSRSAALPAVTTPLPLCASYCSLPSVLSLGFRLARGDSNSALVDRPSVESVDINSTSSHIQQSREWQLLTERAGDEVMAHVLLQCFCFAPLPNLCFTQLTGPPLPDAMGAAKGLQTAEPVDRRPTLKRSASATSSPHPSPVKRTCTDPAAVFSAGLAPPSRSSSAVAATAAAGVPSSSVLQRVIPQSAVLYQQSSRWQVGLPPQRPTRPHNTPQPSHVQYRRLRADRMRTAVLLVTDALNVLQPSKTGARRLLATVFGLPSVGKTARQQDGPAGGRTARRLNIACSRPARSVSSSLPPPPPQRLRSSIPRSTRTPPHFQPLLPHFRRLLRNHRYCPYGSLFAAHPSCCLTRSALDQLSFGELLSSACPQPAVVTFVRSVLARLVPLAACGSEHNRAQLLDSAAQLVRLRKGEAMIVREVVHGMKTSDVRWLATPPQRRADRFHQQRRVELLSRLCLWVLTDVVVPLLRCSFYVTDTETGKNRLSYYPHAVWQRICRHMFATLTSSSCSVSSTGAALPPQFRRLSVAERAALVRHPDAVLGVSHLRPRPRKAAIRPIVNMARNARISVNGEQRQWRSVNLALRNAFDVLTFERSRQSGLLGSSVFSVADVYEQYSAFVSLLRRERIVGCAPLYVVCVDIAQCFDCIDRERLCQLLPTVLRDESYALQRYSALHDKLGSVTSRYQRMVYAAGSFPSFPSSIAPLMAERSNRRVYVDLVNRSLVPSSTLLSVMQSHLRSNVVQYAGRLYVQERGIPQGSALSALLCCMYLGEWENKHVVPLLRKMEERPRSKGKRGSNGQRKRVVRSCNLLMRHMDDLLFITSDWKVAERFLPSITASLASRGLSLNEHKTKANFDVAALSAAHQWAKSSAPPPATRCEWIAWNGLLLHPVTLELKLDYSRLLLSAPSLSRGASSGRSCLSAHLTVQTCSHPGVAFARSICRFISARAHPLLLDARLHSTPRIASNWYGMYLVCGMRLLCYARELRRRRHGFVNERMMHAAMARSVEFGWSVVRSRLSRLARDSGGSGEAKGGSGAIGAKGGVGGGLCGACVVGGCYLHPLFPLSSCHVRWLAWCAYSQALERKHSRFPELMRLARQERGRAEKHVAVVSLGVGCVCCERWHVLTRLRPLLWSEHQPLLQQCSY